MRGHLCYITAFLLFRIIAVYFGILFAFAHHDILLRRYSSNFRMKANTNCSYLPYDAVQSAVLV